MLQHTTSVEILGVEAYKYVVGNLLTVISSYLKWIECKTCKKEAG